MLPDATFDPVPPRPKRRLRFSLLALLIFVTLVSVGLAWLVQPNRVSATALFHVDSVPQTMLNTTVAPSRRETDFETIKKTQLALLKSHFVLNAAVRNPSVAASPLLRSQKDPVEWLRDNLEVDFPQNAEILAISLRGPEAHANDLVQIVDAIAKAYLNEVVFREKQRRGGSRDMLVRSLNNLNKTIERKWEQYIDIARESGRTVNGSSQIMQELDIKRLDRIERELMRLEGDQLAVETKAQAGDSKFLEQRIAQLREQQSELIKRIESRSEPSVELDTREQELTRLQGIAHELAVLIEKLDIEATAFDRIRQIQQAVLAK